MPARWRNERLNTCQRLQVRRNPLASRRGRPTVGVMISTPDVPNDIDTRFEPRRAIVSASDSGVGRAAAAALATAGMDVGITWHQDEQGASDTADEVRSHGVRAVVARLDTTDIPGCGDVIDRLSDELGGLDVFVNNAGTGRSILLLDLDYDEWNHIVTADLSGAFVCIQRAARRMAAARTGGRIIAVSSVHEHQPRVGSSAYDAAKHGLGGLVKTAALELAPYGITVNTVAPGEIATPMTGQTDDDPHATARPGIPIGRPGRRSRGGSRDRLPGLSCGELCHGQHRRRRRRDAADGSAGRLASHLERLAVRVARFRSPGGL